MGLLGMGNGSVFQLVPQRFPKEIGVMTGVVGAAGGIGGFFLPNVFGGMKWLTGSYGTGFAVIAGVACCAWSCSGGSRRGGKVRSSHWRRPIRGADGRTVVAPAVGDGGQWRLRPDRKSPPWRRRPAGS